MTFVKHFCIFLVLVNSWWCFGNCCETQLIADLDGNCQINFSDLAIFSAYWQMSSNPGDSHIAFIHNEPQLTKPVKLNISTTSEIDIYALSPINKIHSYDDLKSLASLTYDSKIEIALAKNESEQIVIALNPDAEMQNVFVEFGEFSGPSTIPTQLWSWQRIIEVNVPGVSDWYGVKGRETGLVPDPIVPGELFIAPAGLNSMLLITVKVSSSAIEGKYEGQIKILNDSTIVAIIPVILEIWNITLPNERSIITAASSLGSSAYDAQSLMNFEVSHHKYGASGLTTYWSSEANELTLYTDNYKNTMTNIVDNIGVSQVALPPSLLGGIYNLSDNYLGTGVSVGTPEFWPIFRQFTQKMGDFYRQYSWEDKVFWYMMDEIDSQYYPLISQITSEAKMLFPEMDIWLVTNDMPSYLAASLDSWVVPWHFFVTDTDDIPNWDALRQEGLTLIAYMNSLYFINAEWNFKAMRFFPAVLAKYGYKGSLWWQMNLYEGGNPWQQACASSVDIVNNKKLYGSGYLLYPPRDGDNEIEVFKDEFNNLPVMTITKTGFTWSGISLVNDSVSLPTSLKLGGSGGSGPSYTYVLWDIGGTYDFCSDTLSECSVMVSRVSTANWIKVELLDSSLNLLATAQHHFNDFNVFHKLLIPLSGDENNVRYVRFTTYRSSGTGGTYVNIDDFIVEHLDGWHSSMRWENYRQGLDEFEMMNILGQRWQNIIDELGIKNLSSMDQNTFSVDNALRRYGSMLASEFRLQTYRSDGSYINRYRQLLAHEIMRLTEPPFAVVDIQMNSWETSEDSVLISGFCDAGTRVDIADSVFGWYRDVNPYTFSFEYPLSVGTNVIPILISDKNGNSKVIYREIVRVVE